MVHTFVANVQSDLINNNPEKYLRKAISGQVSGHAFEIPLICPNDVKQF